MVQKFVSPMSSSVFYRNLGLKKDLFFFAGDTPLAEQEPNETKLELLELELLIIESGTPQKIGII